jgi:hypothetical protein
MTTRPRDLLRATNPDWQRVSSSNVHSALFAPDPGDFYVRFLRSGPDQIYVYPNRSRSEWEDFRTAMSKGGWIHEHPIAESWPFDLLTTRAFADVERGDLRPAQRRFLE